MKERWFFMSNVEVIYVGEQDYLIEVNDLSFTLTSEEFEELKIKMNSD